MIAGMLNDDRPGAGAALAARPAVDGDLAQRIETPEAIIVDTPLKTTLDTFRRHPQLRFFAVVDARRRPVGAIYERMVREYLFSPFGHALLGNPGYSHALGQFVQPCPTIDIATPVEALVRAYGRAGDAEGIILTRDGRYAALLPSQALLQLAAAMANERSQRLEAAFDGFRRDALEFGRTLLDAAGEIGSGASGVAERAALNGRQAIAVATASRQATDGIAEISASSSLVADRVRAVEAQLMQAKGSFGDAVDRVASGAAQAETLAGAADEIATIIGLISDVARRVNMLAINATIEAARAGPAGRGFAIVAAEVKSLAAQAAAAAKDIGQRIGSFGGAIGETAASHRRISDIVTNLDTIASAILASAAEQSTATMQIAENVEQAAAASGQITSYVTEMSERARSAEQLAHRMASVAGSLTGAADQLQSRVEVFLGEIRTA